MVCSRCNHEYSSELERCPICGEPNPNWVAQDGSQGTRQQSSGNQNAWSQTSQTYANQKSYQAAPPAATGAPNTSVNPSAVLVMGVLSLFFPFVGIVLGILAIVWGAKARKMYLPGDANYAIANAGWVLGIVGLVMQALMIVYVGIIYSFVTDLLTAAMSSSLPFDYFSY